MSNADEIPGSGESALEAGHSLARPAVLVILYVLFAIASVLLFAEGRLLVARDPTNWLALLHILEVVGTVGVGLFGSLSVRSIRKMIQAKTVLTIDSGGIDDRTSSLSLGRIHWDQILDLEEREDSMLVHVRDPEALISRAGPIKRVALRLRTGRTGTPVHIGVIGLRIPAEQLIDRMEDEMNRHALEEIRRAKLSGPPGPSGG